MIGLAITILVAALAGCASNKSIPVTSNPEGATVYVDGRKIGTTPLQVTMDDLLPTRATDGKFGTSARLAVEKEGFFDWHTVVEEWSAPNSIHATLASKPIAEYYEDYSKRSPGILNSTLAPSGPPVILSSQNLDADSDQLFGQGYILIGFAGIAGEEVTQEQIVKQAQTVGAAIAVVHSRLTHVQTEMREVTIHIPGRAATTFTHGSGTTVSSGSGTETAYGPSGSPVTAIGNYSGTSSSWYSASGITVIPGVSRTEFVPFSSRQFDTKVTFWRKRKPTATGVYSEPVPPALRQTIKRNTGAFVVAIEDGSPGFLADVLPGDVVVGIDGRPVRSPAELEMLAKQKQGRVAHIQVMRDGRIVKLALHL